MHGGGNIVELACQNERPKGGKLNVKSNSREGIMKHVQALLLATAAVCIASSAAHAMCESALVMSTYNSATDVRSDWRLADLVDRQTYEQIKRDAGANAVIYGIPVGANYGEWKDAAARLRHAHNESLSKSQLVNIAWTGFDPQTSQIYLKCLRNRTIFSTWASSRCHCGYSERY